MQYRPEKMSRMLDLLVAGCLATARRGPDEG